MRNEIPSAGSVTFYILGVLQVFTPTSVIDFLLSFFLRPEVVPVFDPNLSSTPKIEIESTLSTRLRGTGGI